MGVFDDAIRQHLDLKRKQGADEDELKELEDEAFGLPARPGEPDFPDREEGDDASSGESGEEPDAVADKDADADPDAPAHETGAGDDEGDEPEPEAPPEPATALMAEPGPEPPDDPQDADADEPEPSSFTTAEREAIAEQPTVFFDQAEAGELDFEDLDLELDDEPKGATSSGSETDAEEGWGDEPVTGEEELGEEPEPPHEREPEPPSEEMPAASIAAPELDTSDPGTAAPDTSEELEPISEELSLDDAEPVTGEEDVLEETPEFLRDNPDDDELWFEQGEPKDFDF